MGPIPNSLIIAPGLAGGPGPEIPRFPASRYDSKIGLGAPAFRHLRIMSHSKKHIFTERCPIRWGDMDAYGHVNNTVFFRFMEQARIAWMESVGLDLVSPEQGPVIINASCTFLKQLDYPGTVEVKMYAGELGRSSVMSYYELRKEGERDLYAEGAAKIVWSDQRVRKSMPIPDEFRKALER